MRSPSLQPRDFPLVDGPGVFQVAPCSSRIFTAFPCECRLDGVHFQSMRSSSTYTLRGAVYDPYEGVVNLENQVSSDRPVSD